MKIKTRIAASLIAAAIAVLGLGSCQPGAYEIITIESQPNALVTVKPAGDGCLLWIDDNTVARPANIAGQPYGDIEVRALANLDIRKGQALDGTCVAVVNSMSKVLTKEPVVLGAGDELAKYGDAPVEIRNSWRTLCEDGYLNLDLMTRWGSASIAHELNLVAGTNPDDPYEFVFCHNPHGDKPLRECGTQVAFRLYELIEGNAGDVVKVTLRWNSFSGEKSHVFDYRIR